MALEGETGTETPKSHREAQSKAMAWLDAAKPSDLYQDRSGNDQRRLSHRADRRKQRDLSFNRIWLDFSVASDGPGGKEANPGKV